MVSDNEFPTAARVLAHCSYLLNTLLTGTRLSFRNRSKGGETAIFLEWGARKGLDLRTIIQQFHSRGGENISRGGERPSPPPLNETLGTATNPLVFKNVVVETMKAVNTSRLSSSIETRQVLHTC